MALMDSICAYSVSFQQYFACQQGGLSESAISHMSHICIVHPNGPLSQIPAYYKGKIHLSNERGKGLLAPTFWDSKP
jgi:hypothetical protein